MIIGTWGTRPPRVSSSISARLLPLLNRIRRARPGTEDLATRFALLIFGIAALTATRSLSFIHSVPDRSLPPIRPLIWLFHQADMLFVPGGNRLSLASVQLVQFVALVVSLFCFFFAARSTIPTMLRRFHRSLVRAAVVLAALLCVLNLQGVLPYPISLGTEHYGNDAITVTACAAADTVRGRNTYPLFDVGRCLNKHDQQGFKTTPLQAGKFKTIQIYPSRIELQTVFRDTLRNHVKHPPEFESYYSYPSVSFLIPAIFLWLHIQDLTILYLLCYAVLAGLVIWRAPTRAAKRMAATAVAANAALWPTIISGATDAMYSLLVLVAWSTRERRWLSAVLMGVACSARQQAWFFLLFYLVLVWKTKSPREMWLRLAIVAGVFAATNLPYFIASPGPWLTGVLGPMRDPMFPRGSGIIALSTGGVGSLPLGPRWLYAVLETGGLIASLVYYWRICRKHPGTGLVLAPVALLFAWRSLYSYFLPLSLLALYPALVEHARPEEVDPIDEHAAAAPEATAAA